MNLWDKTVEALQTTVQPYDYVHWIRPLRCLQVDHQRRELVLSAPDDSHGRWVEDNFLRQIERTLSSFTVESYSVRLESRPSGEFRPIQRKEGPAAPPIGKPDGLIERYRFENFVDGPTNQFALTAARAVAEHGGTRYNPLFIYGGVGLGKTHLLHAVGHLAYDRNPRTRIRYVTSETYVNDLINAIRTDTMHEFRRKYRDNCDFLLIDDIQFIAGKDRTQEEFFHMFNTLHSSHKQIVMTCDQVPRSIPDMEDRIKSRLEWGLITDIKPPGFETRVAILKAKADADHIDLPDDVAMLLARHINRNVRELEGALMRLSANARIFGTSITLGMAREVLGDLVSEDVRRVSIDAILKATAHDFRVSVSDLKGPRRHRNVTVPRQVAMFLSRQLTDASLPQIGSAFGGRDHTTVINALKRVEALREADTDFGARIERLRKQLVS